MSPLLIAEYMTFDSITLFCVDIYGADGFLVQPFVLAISDPSVCICAMRDFAEDRHIDAFDVWTADRALYGACMGEPGITVFAKHPSDTYTAARRNVESDPDIFRDMYVPQPVEEAPKLPPLPKWRARIAIYVRKLLTKIERADKYEIY
ncbi:hypothetical protein A3844_25000 [Paenibacillus helianthi]|uniref:Uncharacterized protein n=1 Tax=Paenibacillus helianthi TaxID=1349432 RepID=A0ABX3EGU6_9BACL|nr:hypothetical protein [Paenibacillus helianthi]OKP81846.1 hypothetical protein A3844_25000 [Paenibacillus helianthi]